MLSANQIAEKLDESFNLLTGGSRTALPRQQTIRASIEWSWGLLTELEQTLMRQLSIFAGGWTLASAQAIGDGDVLSMTGSLVKKSLIVRNQRSGSETRYHFHEVIRQYAREKLIEAGEEENIRSLHLKYFLEFSELAEPALRGPHQTEWFSRIHDERSNIRVALGQASRSNLEAGLYLTGRLIHYWRNYDLREGLSWATEFVQTPESLNYPHGRAKALFVQGNILWGIQQFEPAHSAAEECIALFRACGDRQGEFEGLMLMGAVMQFLEGMDEKVKLQKQALALAQSTGDVWMQACALSGLGWDRRDPQQARDYWEKAIALFRQAGDWRNLVDVLGILGYTVLLNGDLESAQKFLDEALELNRNMNYKRGMEFVLTGKSYMALMHDECQQARAFLQENADILEEVGNRMGYLWARARLGDVALREGNLAEAHHILIEIVENFRKDRNKAGLAFTLDKMASLHIVLDKSDNAARLIGWSDITRKEIGDPRPQIEQTIVDHDIAMIQTKIGASAFAVAYNAGQAMTMDEAVVFATDEFRL
jgi:non-specific serine/threonine protein kinase